MSKNTNISFRSLTEADFPALLELAEATPDGGRVGAVAQHHINPFHAARLMNPDIGFSGIVAENGVRLAGAGMIQTGETNINGRLQPYAMLNSLVVHPDYRRQGIASQLVKRRVQQINTQSGESTLIMATIQTGNTGSLKAAQKWCQAISRPLTTGMARMRKRPPRTAPYTIRQATVADLDQIVAQQNQFYDGYQLYKPHTAESLHSYLQATPLDTPFRHYYIACNQAGEMVAGLVLAEQYRHTSFVVQRMPGYMRLLNKILGVVPPGGVMRQLRLDKPWFQPDHFAAARYLWDTLRYQWSDRADGILYSYDPKGPLADLLHQPFWMPKSAFMIAYRGELDETRLFIS